MGAPFPTEAFEEDTAVAATVEVSTGSCVDGVVEGAAVTFGLLCGAKTFAGTDFLTAAPKKKDDIDGQNYARQVEYILNFIDWRLKAEQLISCLVQLLQHTTTTIFSRNVHDFQSL